MGVVLQHHRDDARNDGRGLRRAGHREVLVRITMGKHELGVIDCDLVRTIVHQSDDIVAGCDDIGFDESFDSRTGRRE